ncbi:protein zyg-11 homolog isoform X2 [Hypomesus transpacificus]|uniref:protein zyg-11 homolog isoform X2 n=1 Tax=Hypomesus transpacificus TaxID=137520 RepID=UPI001F0867B5|nr:protein zyg-11 homolog isoform X2 [Hypomesus transpacificus]
MGEESPMALADLCLAHVCHSLDSLCTMQADGSLRLHWVPLLPQEMADQLLHKMATEGILNDRTIGIFRDCRQLRLRRACIRSCPVSAEALRLALCPHRLQELDASQVSGGLTGADVLTGLASNPECSSSLQKLTLSGLQLDWEFLKEGGQVSFRSCLILANTDLTDAGLEEVCSLPQLEYLDISSTPVTDLTALLGSRSTLRSLCAHALRQLDMPPAVLLSVLRRLRALRHLDFSDDRFASPSDDNDDGKEGDETVRLLLEGSSGVLPALVSLDLSGRKRVTDGAVRAFVEARPKLVFLGLLATGAGSCEALFGCGSLKVTGEANEGQILEALRRYNERECFIREALVHLYNLSSDLDKPRADILKLVLDGMQKHAQSLHVQLVATACVFNLTNQDLTVGLPLRLLSAILSQLLEAMKNFPNHQQVQKNCLLALCSDYILQDVPFNRYEAAKLVMNWLSSHEDPTLQRMAVAIISILVAKLSKEQTTQLGADIFIMKQLLGIVQQKAMVGVVDSTLKFALSALWNLTDETPTASRHFIQCQGLELYEEVLESYYSESSVQQKVLGLLNNIAEVEELQGNLMEEDLLEHILSLLQGPQVEVGVRYFAGGILAHLTSREAAWTLDEELRATILEQLHSAVMTWTPPEREMVSYRSFHPFLSLLQTSQPSGVQLWAVWAMRLVCSQNAAQYCSMLQEEAAVDLLRALTSHPDTHVDVRGLAECILGILDHHQSQRDILTDQPGQS